MNYFSFKLTNHTCADVRNEQSRYQNVDVSLCAARRTLPLATCSQASTRKQTLISADHVRLLQGDNANDLRHSWTPAESLAHWDVLIMMLGKCLMKRATRHWAQVCSVLQSGTRVCWKEMWWAPKQFHDSTHAEAPEATWSTEKLARSCKMVFIIWMHLEHRSLCCLHVHRLKHNVKFVISHGQNEVLMYCSTCTVHVKLKF